jgi:prevent-host-death family protein
MGRRGPTIADTALELIKTGGPQTLEELAVAVAAAGRTRNANPVNAVLNAIAHDDRFLESDGRWLSLMDLLDGAITTYRLTDIERLHQVIVLGDEDSLIERIARSSRRSGSAGRLILSSVGSAFDLPWDDETAWPSDPICLDRSDLSDPEAAWDYLAANRWKSVFVIPQAQMPTMQPNDLLGVAVRDGSLEVMAITPADIDANHVASAVGVWADLIEQSLSPDGDGRHGGPSVIALIETIALTEPEILRKPLPPTADMISAAGFHLCNGRITPQHAPTIDVVPKRSDDHYNDHMTKRMTATDLKARLLGVLEEVAAGEVVEVTKRGRVIARVVPATASHGLRGSMRGTVTTNASDEELFTTGEPWNVS